MDDREKLNAVESLSSLFFRGRRSREICERGFNYSVISNEGKSAERLFGIINCSTPNVLSLLQLAHWPDLDASSRSQVALPEREASLKLSLQIKSALKCLICARHYNSKRAGNHKYCAVSAAVLQSK